MKYLLILSAICFLAACSKSNENNNHPANPAGLGPQGGQEANQPNNPVAAGTDEEKLKPVLTLGKRAVEWLNLVNAKRSTETRLNLADRSSKNPVPPESPKITSIPLILEKLNVRTSEIPEAMRAYLLDNKDLVETPPVDDAVFLTSIRDINKVYQSAIRWIGQVPYFDEYYSKNDVYDIRGIYFFKKEFDLETKLVNFEDLEADTQNNYKNWLVSMCHNSFIPLADCRKELQDSEIHLSTEHVYFDYYKKYAPQAEKIYDSFFTVEKLRQDLIWNQDRTVITQAFENPNNSKVSDWLKTNVEEEWKFVGFKLLVDFVQKNEISPWLEFIKGVTPHVSGDTNNKITMDPDYSLDDYDTQWTIRHEFGHVLGFPDCYLEFYDSEKGEMNYYTIEPDNLMCAWGGKLQESHAEQLRKVY